MSATLAILCFLLLPMDLSKEEAGNSRQVSKFKQVSAVSIVVDRNLTTFDWSINEDEVPLRLSED